MGFFSWLKGKQSTSDVEPKQTDRPRSPTFDEDELTKHIEAVEDALSAPLREIYGDQQPFSYGAGVLWEDGGPDPLSSVQIFWNDNGPHWHYVSFGMSELYEKTSNNPDISGWGFELTFRLLARPEDKGTEPEKFFGSIAYNAPKWPIASLNELGRMVWKSGRPFANDDFVFNISFPDGVRPGVFLLDQDLGAVTTPNGRVRFLDVRSISRKDLERLKAQDKNPAEYDRVITDIRSRLPMANEV